MESDHFRLGQFHDECFKALPSGDKIIRWRWLCFSLLINSDLSGVWKWINPQSNRTRRRSKRDQNTFTRLSLGSLPSGWTSRKMKKPTNETSSKNWMRLFPELSENYRRIRCNNSENSCANVLTFFEVVYRLPANRFARRDQQFGGV